MPRRSFRDSVTNILKAHGYVAVNAPGDLVRDEPDDFALAPGQWKWDGAAWVAYIKSATEIDAEKDARASQDMDDARLRAVIRALLDEIDSRHPANQVDRAAFRARAIGYLKALLT